MGLESFGFISDLVSSNPTGTDFESQGDDHIRGIKSSLQATFPAASRAVYFGGSKQKTSNYTLTNADENGLIVVDATSGAVTITTPSGPPDGYMVTIIKVDASSNAVIIDPPSTQGISNQLTYSLTTQFNSVRLAYASATDWYAIPAYYNTPYYPGGTNIPFSDIAPSGTEKRILGAVTATDFSEQSIATVLEWLDTFSQGDLLSRGASIFGRLAIGTAGQLFRVNSGATAGEWATPSSMTVNRAYAEITAMSSNATTTPGDDTIPQVGEGTEILTISYTPKNSGNRLRIEASIPFSMATGSALACIHMHKDGAANAVASRFLNHSLTGAADGADKIHELHLMHEQDAGGISAQTWSVRIGASAGAIRVNGFGASTRYGGGTMKATLTITEFTP